MRRALLPLFAFLLTAGFLAAAAPRTMAENAVDAVQEQVLRMTEFFDTRLPGVLEEHNLTLHFKPKFSDLRDEEYMRFPVELRYGLSDRWELSGGVTPFVPNPINSGRDHRWGPGEIKFGVRHDLGRLLNFFQETTVGFETRIPWGKPPIEVNDHYTHVKPYVSAARKLLRWPSTTFYANLSYDRSVKLTPREPAPPEVSRRNIIELSPGLLYRPSELGYFAEYHYRHIGQDHEWHLAHEIQVGTIWDVPLARSERWRLPGKWQIELAYKAGYEEGLGDTHGIAARVNWRTTIREVLAKANTPWSK